MSFGLLINDLLGARQIDLAASLTRVLGIFELSADGSASNAALALGKPWYVCQPYVNTGPFSPQVGFSGNTMSWSFANGRTSTCLMIYGTR